ncbi:hypothetical protein [Propionivibrio sp.]|uniref:hypothetical protein n=1 Tax=Propionivibrio sp. TaxID=2212460 RepID=UPI0039E67ADE
MPNAVPEEFSIVADMAARLNVVQRECYEERAGILEFDAGLDRPLAEALALLEVIRRYDWPPT